MLLVKQKATGLTTINWISLQPTLSYQVGQNKTFQFVTIIIANMLKGSFITNWYHLENHYSTKQLPTTLSSPAWNRSSKTVCLAFGDIYLYINATYLTVQLIQTIFITYYPTEIRGFFYRTFPLHLTENTNNLFKEYYLFLINIYLSLQILISLLKKTTITKVISISPLGN